MKKLQFLKESSKFIPVEKLRQFLRGLVGDSSEEMCSPPLIYISLFDLHLTLEIILFVLKTVVL